MEQAPEILKLFVEMFEVCRNENEVKKLSRNLKKMIDMVAEDINYKKPSTGK